MSHRLNLAVASILFCTLNPVFASPSIHDSDYAAVLTDPSDGMKILESAQDGMLSVNNDIAQKMFNIALKAASGRYTREQLDKFDIEFQKYKWEYFALLSKQTLNGSLIFNQGNFSFVKNNIKYVIDLAPKNTIALGITDDNLLNIDSAKTAIEHVNAAIDNINHWIPQGNENNSVSHAAISKNDNAQVNNYFDSSTLYIKSFDGSESALKSIKYVQNQLIDLLIQIKIAASKATSEVLTPVDRANLNEELQGCMYQINQIVASASFTTIQAFDGSALVVHDIKQGDKMYTLPELPYRENIMDDDVLSPQNANTALHDLVDIRDRLAIWLVDGIFNHPFVSSRVPIPPYK